MKKQEFLKKLRASLRGLPKAEIEERISFFSEMIDDRIDEGLSEEAAVASVAKAEKAECDGKKKSKTAEKNESTPKRLRGWELAVIICGSPIWLSLAIAALAVTISLIAALFAVTVSLWAVFVAFAASTPAALIIGLVQMFTGATLAGVVMFSGACVLFGLAIFSFFGCLYLTKYIATLIKKIIKSIVVIKIEEGGK